MWQTASPLSSAFSWQKVIKAKKARPPSLVHISPSLLKWLPFCKPFLWGLSGVTTNNGRSQNNWSVRSLLVTKFPLHSIHQPISFFVCLVSLQASFCDSWFPYGLGSHKACLCTCMEHTHISTFSCQGPILQKPFLILNNWGESWLGQHSIPSSQSVTD